MESPEELFNCGQYISDQLVNELDGTFLERVEMAHAISCISSCSLRIRKTSVSDETFHVINKFFGMKESQFLPFFSVTHEQEVDDEQLDVSIGFTVHNNYFVMYEIEGCFDCGDEEFCSKQPDEVQEENFEYLDPVLLSVIERFSELWSPVLADFANSFGIEYMYENVAFILDQVFDCWRDVPSELEKTYEDYHFDASTNSIRKNKDLCIKDECSDLSNSSGLCYSHEDYCRVRDCFSYKDSGAYCYSHEDNH
jgi:hypothetical protein